MWSNSILERLRSAQELGSQDLQTEIAKLLEGCPFSSWPYGCSSSVNPWVVFLGPSPGASPAHGDSNYVTRIGRPPTAGEPCESMLYSDSRGFFDRLRLLTCALIDAEAGRSVTQPDALALAGMMNLDSGASGEARNVTIDIDFARWAIDVSIRRLRPRYVVGVGLAGILGKSERLCEVLGEYTGGVFDPNQPPISKSFDGYSRIRYKFRAWPLLNGGATRQYLILFPQHPSRAPMTSPEVWDHAVREFVVFATTLEQKRLPLPGRGTHPETISQSRANTDTDK
jgi:hypothetical protein